MTNDRMRSRTILSMKGHVKIFANIYPSYVRLIGPGDIEVKKTLTITKLKQNPFNITRMQAKNGKNIRFSIEPFKNADASGYRLDIVNTRTEKGRYSDLLMLYTDSKVKPVIKISVYGNISDSMGSNKINTQNKKS